METITRQMMLQAMHDTKNGIMVCKWPRRTDKKDKATKQVIEPAGTIREMRFVAYRDTVKKYFTPAGGFFANASSEESANKIKRQHSLCVVFPVEGEKEVDEHHPKAIPWSDVTEFVCGGVTYKVIENDESLMQHAQLVPGW